MPPAAMDRMHITYNSHHDLALLRDGLGKIDSENARAGSPDDEHKLKKIIREGLGFDAVDAAVKYGIMRWCEKAVKHRQDQERAEKFALLSETSGVPLSPTSATSASAPFRTSAAEPLLSGSPIHVSASYEINVY